MAHAAGTLEPPVGASQLEFNGERRDHRISLEHAVPMVERYRERHPDGIHASMFDRAIFDDILAQAGCTGIRMYYAEGTDGAQTLVLVGVDARGNDLYRGLLGEWGSPCPPACSRDSPLRG